MKFNSEKLKKYLVKRLHHRALSKSTGAIAGLASGISVVVGILAAHAAPKGLAKLSIALHLSSKPLIIKLAPFIAGFAVAAGTAAGFMKFYSWCKEAPDAPDEDDIVGRIQDQMETPRSD